MEIDSNKNKSDTEEFGIYIYSSNKRLIDDIYQSVVLE